MKKIHKISPLIFLVLLTSCGLIEKFKTPTEPTSSESQTETASSETEKNEDSFFAEAFNDAKDEPINNLENTTDAPNNIVTDNMNEAPINTTPTDVEKDLASLEKDMPIEIKEEPKVVATSQLSEAGSLTSNLETYTVQKGETLMQIAFKLYGDLSKWKTLKELNQSNLAGGTLKKGTKIKYYVPETPFSWNPQGTPYLIKHGDTLGTISNSVYQTPKKWKKIWENNKPLIKNPNKIFAGFTLYYLTEGLAENSIQENSSRENYVETTAVDKIAEKEMETFKNESTTETTLAPTSTAETSPTTEKAVTISDVQTLGANEDELLTVTPIANDELLEEVEQINAKDLTKMTKSDEQTMAEIEELAGLKDEEITSTQSSVQR